MDVRVINDLVQQQSAFVDKLAAEVGKVIVGQKTMVDRLLIGLLTGGHVLLEGVPGLAKTLTVKTLADALSMRFQRIQFTPDLLPADIVGTVIYNQAKSEFISKKGPIFANLVLADEINRAPAKVQSALLEAMQERQVTIGDTTHPLPDPFLVMATQNPIEQEGTYALPEAQLDRFMLMIKVGYPSKEDERTIMDRMTAGIGVKAEPVAIPRHIADARSVISQIYIDDKIKDYIVNLVHATREPKALRPGRAGRLHPLRRQPARVDLPEPGGPGPRLPAPARLRHPRGREGHRRRRAPPPGHPHLRGRGRGDDHRAGRAQAVRAHRGALIPGSSQARHADPGAAQEDPPASRSSPSGWCAIGWPGSTTRCSRAAASPSPRCAQYTPGRRHPADRLERVGPHERAVREAVRRGARDAPCCCWSTCRPRGGSARASRRSASWRPSWARCSPSPPSATTTGWA